MKFDPCKPKATFLFYASILDTLEELSKGTGRDTRHNQTNETQNGGNLK